MAILKSYLPQLHHVLVLLLALTNSARADAIGTGFFINEQGDILTNRHVIEGCERLFARLPDESLVKLELIATSKAFDLAALRSGRTTNRFLALRTSPDFKFPMIPVDDEEVFTVGYSYFDENQGQSHGVAGRVISRPDDVARDDLALRIDVTPGSSGSPIVGRDMLLVGVITAGKAFDDLPDEMAGYYGDNLVLALSGNAIAQFVNETGIRISTWHPNRWFLPHQAWDHLLATTSLIICRN